MNKQKVIRNFALANAVKYSGSAKPGNIVGSVVQAYPDWKAEIKSLMPMIVKIVAEVNKLTVAEQMAELQEHAPELLEKKRDERPKDQLKPLPHVTYGEVVMRFEPSPSGTLHIGHSIPLLLNSEYCKEYKGKLILRIADTNPDNICVEAYEMIPQDAKWITENNISSVEIQSDRMEIYHSYGLRLIEGGNAYVCMCEPEDFRSLITKQLACPCREKGVKEHTSLWHKMHTDMPEGEGVVRMKTDIRHKNPALRDFSLFRINENEHPRQGHKYRVWPLMNLAVAVDDHDMGLTHVLRGKDHLDNTRRQMYIYDAFKWTPPEFIHIGKVNFKGLKLSASGAAQSISVGEYTGWDDIRLPFLPALRKRGYVPAAFTKFVKTLGVTMVDKSVEAGEFYKSLNYFNKEVVDSTSHRYYFIENPKEVIISGAPLKEVELDLHPENVSGGRSFECGEKYLLAAKDVDAFMNGELIRLIDNLNFNNTTKGLLFHSEDYKKWKGIGQKIIHWLPSSHLSVRVRLVMDNGAIRLGVGEAGLKDLEVGKTIQFERVCFATYQGEVGGAHEFWYLHR